MKEARVLLPNDAFGQHLASGRRFADQLERKVVMEEALSYYANILIEIDATLRAMGLEVVDPLEIRYVPSEEQPGACEEYGRQVAQKVKGWS